MQVSHLIFAFVVAVSMAGRVRDSMKHGPHNQRVSGTVGQSIVDPSLTRGNGFRALDEEDDASSSVSAEEADGSMTARAEVSVAVAAPSSKLIKKKHPQPKDDDVEMLDELIRQQQLANRSMPNGQEEAKKKKKRRSKKRSNKKTSDGVIITTEVVQQMQLEDKHSGADDSIDSEDYVIGDEKESNPSVEDDDWDMCEDK